jgi:16S rRNA (cytosine967-C5)-methyltransferase
VLVYSTCTLLPEENEAIVEAFLRESKSFRRAEPARLAAELAPVLDAEGNLRCLPHRHDSDGFFAARLEHAP